MEGMISIRSLQLKEILQLPYEKFNKNTMLKCE